MISAMALLTAMDAVVKSLTLAGVAVIQILAIRSCLIVPTMVVACAIRGNLTDLKPENARAQLARGLVGASAPLCFFMGITHIPLTDAVVVFFCSIFFTTLLAIVFLGEKVGIHHWTSVIAGFIGVLIVVGPKGGGHLGGYALVLMGSLAYSVLFISGRYLSKTESVASMVMAFNVCTGAVSLALLPWFWSALSLGELAFISLLSALALGGHYTITMAFSKAEASVLTQFEYTGILWAVLLDAMIWQLSPTPSTMAGALIIVASGLYIVHRERVDQPNSGVV